MKITFNSTFEYKLIYIFRINDNKHNGLLKIGDATIHTNKNYDELFNNCHDLNQAAKERIDSYTTTAGIVYELLHTEIAVFKDTNKNSNHYGKTRAFRDYDVHEVLMRSGIEKKYFDTNKKQNEWFATDLQTAINAIAAVKKSESALDNKSITRDRNPIIFRPEQEKAIKDTKTVFKTKNRMLWNAKMRFGKTLSALQIVKDTPSFKKTIIITHRPVVSDGWYKDFDKVFYDRNDFFFSSKTKGKKLKELLNSNSNFVYFASMQDLRGSDIVGGNYEKNQEIFNIDWDFVVVDEAHEGTQTSLGKDVLENIIKPDSNHTTKILEMSGTPFNLLTNFDEDNIYTWDYIMEQEAKEKWYLEHFCDSNPYEELPKMNIYTYHLEKYLKGFEDIEDKAFSFKEFFRIYTGDINKDYERIPEGKSVGDFVHEKDVRSFLDLICKKDDESNYPYSTDEYRDFFRHSLWMVPGVREAKALSKLLKEHEVFQHFKIVNVAGDGDEEKNYNDALEEVRSSITDHPENTYTITLSCGRLTTGVSIPEWTSVLMLYGSSQTAASQYLQTIFRVQTPANINGKIKENAFVFDFAPDRTLRVVAESVQLSAKTGNTNEKEEIILGKFLNYCPVIAIDESSMKKYKVPELMQQLKKVYIDKVVRNGFDDVKLYDSNLLTYLTDVELKDFEDLKKKIGKTNQTKNVNSIQVNDEGFTNEQLEELKRIEKKPTSQRTEEEKKKIEEARKARENKNKAIAILRGISIRIPLMVYGLDKDINEDITIEKFADEDMIDDLSWAEFMPEGIDRATFRKFAKYYDKNVFIAASKRIRDISKSADDLEPTERVNKIAKLFSTFKNPDKETVLTPWRTVNIHMGETLGGYCFYDETFNNYLEEPRLINNGDVSEDTLLNADSQILEINSKTGLYPLYVVYSLYRKKCSEIKDEILTFEKKQEIWDQVVSDNVFVVCKTPMAKSITRRTLVGYRDVKANTRYFEDLINQFKDSRKEANFISKVKKGKSYWGKDGKDDNMKFNAVVGNPPYQGVNHQQIYPYFYLTSIKMADYVSLIFPTGWQEPKNANNLGKLNNEEVKADKEIVFIDNRQNVFPGVSGAEWVNVILWKKDYDNGLEGQQLIYTNGENPREEKLLWDEKEISKPVQLIKMAEIVKNKPGFESISTITSTRKPYGLPTDIFKDPVKAGFSNMTDEKISDEDIKIYGASNVTKYIPRNTLIPRKPRNFDKYKIFVAYAWGNMCEKTGLGGAYSDIIIGYPYEIVTETYLTSGCFDDYDTAKKHAKYLMTKFARALLYVNKFSRHSTTSWGAIPIQDYSEDWWNKSIKEINHELFKKYNIPLEIEDYVNNNFQTKSEANITNFE